ncbi:MAG: hypothetical protein O9262_07535, partial [Cyclobacteriaceae bacterium]|nr:hypothetical protein [Cyclobacteriaceae bacterium]
VTITIPAGALTGSTTVSVPTVNDTVFEQTETFALNGTVTSANTANTNPIGIGTITEDVTDTPTVTITGTTVTEGGTVIFTASIGNPSTTDIVIEVVTNTGSASNDDIDEITTPVIIIIPAGSLTGSSTVSVPTTNDTIFEQTETFTLNGNVTSGNTTNVNPVGTGTITEDITDTPTVIITGTSVPEGTDVVFTASINNISTTDVVMTVLTNPGTASNLDFNPITIPVTITIPAGSTTGSNTVPVSTIPDGIAEPQEQFTLVGTVTSGNTTNANPIGTGIILADSLLPTVSLTGTTVVESNNVIFTASVDLPSATAIILTVLTGDDLTPGAIQATSGLDYNPITNAVTITIPAGALTGSTTVSVPTVNDTVFEQTETFALNGTVTSANTANT